jgi:hypothetical protein
MSGEMPPEDEGQTSLDSQKETETFSATVAVPGTLLGLHKKEYQMAKGEVRKLPQGSWGPGGVAHVVRLSSNQDVEYPASLKGSQWYVPQDNRVWLTAEGWSTPESRKGQE